MKRGKKYIKISKDLDRNKSYTLEEGLKQVKKTSYSKFVGSLEVHFDIVVPEEDLYIEWDGRHHFVPIHGQKDLNNRINRDKIKNKIKSLTVFLSSNEPYGFVKENEKIFKEKLNAKVIILKNRSHFSTDEGITELPEILDEI